MEALQKEEVLGAVLSIASYTALPFSSHYICTEFVTMTVLPDVPAPYLQCACLPDGM